ncbi:MAG: hypothetical protein ACREM1_20555 [Longimicrobiales bacterium]
MSSYEKPEHAYVYEYYSDARVLERPATFTYVCAYRTPAHVPCTR